MSLVKFGDKMMFWIKIKMLYWTKHAKHADAVLMEWGGNTCKVFKKHAKLILMSTLKFGTDQHLDTSPSSIS